jgi:hypothetical protein
MIGGQGGTTFIYDVTDPVRPRLQCRVLGTSAHLSGETNFAYLDPRSADQTNIVTHWFADGHESSAAALPVSVSKGAWLPNGILSAYTVPIGASMQVWLYEGGTSSLLFTYPIPAVGCHGCRFGLPPQVLAVSPDAAGYLVAGWALGKGGAGLAVYRMSDRARVATFDQAVSAFWDRSGHRLFVIGTGGDLAQVWTPESGLSSVAGAAGRLYLAGLSPDGGQIAYTASIDPNSPKWRVFVYDQKTAKTRMLVDKLRTQVLFVRSGWVWYLEEVPCDAGGCQQMGTVPTGKVFAMQLSSGTETEVIFEAGENPVKPAAEVNWLPFAPGEFWPLS